MHNAGSGTPKYLEAKPSRCLFVHHKPHEDWRGMRVRDKKQVNKPPEPWQGPRLNLT